MNRKMREREMEERNDGWREGKRKQKVEVEERYKEERRKEEVKVEMSEKVGE